MRLGILTDSHVPSRANPGTPAVDGDVWLAGAEARLLHALDACQAAHVDLVVILGDLIHDVDPATIERLLRYAAATGLSVRLVPGNHECAPDPDWLGAMLLHLGHPAVHLAQPDGEAFGSLMVAGLSVVELANDAAGGLRVPSLGLPATHAWSDQVVLLLSHCPVLIPPRWLTGKSPWYRGDPANLAAVAALLQSRRGPTVVLHGHVHLRDVEAEGPILQLSCGALALPPFEVTLIELEALAAGRLRLHRRGLTLAPCSLGAAPRALAPQDDVWEWIAPSWRRCQAAPGPSGATVHAHLQH